MRGPEEEAEEADGARDRRWDIVEVYGGFEEGKDWRKRLRWSLDSLLL